MKCFRGSNVSELVAFNEMADSEFSIELCTRGYCRGDIRDDWYLVDDDYPCVEHREGPLCGQCKPGFALTLYSTVSWGMRPDHVVPLGVSSVPEAIPLGRLVPLSGKVWV